MIGGFQVGPFQPAYQQVSGPDSPQHIIWGTLPNEKRRSFYKRFNKRIPEPVQEIIEEIVAAQQYDDSPRITAAAQEANLRAELKAQNIAWRKIYKEALMALIEQENEDEAIVMLMFEM